MARAAQASPDSGLLFLERAAVKYAVYIYIYIYIYIDFARTHFCERSIVYPCAVCLWDSSLGDGVWRRAVGDRYHGARERPE